VRNATQKMKIYSQNVMMFLRTVSASAKIENLPNHKTTLENQNPHISHTQHLRHIPRRRASYNTGVHLAHKHLTGVHLMDVHLIGVSIIDPPLQDGKLGRSQMSGCVENLKLCAINLQSTRPAARSCIFQRSCPVASEYLACFFSTPDHHLSAP
jgi:hypothetical protein